MNDTTNHTYPLYSEDHPKFGSNNVANAQKLEAPQAAHLKDGGAPQGLGLDVNFASDIANAFHAQRNVRRPSARKGSTVDYKDFLSRRNRRQDSQATLVDFARRPSRTNEGKFRLNVIPNDGTVDSPDANAHTPKMESGSPSFHSDATTAKSRPGSSKTSGTSPDLSHGGQWGKFQWRPGISPLQVPMPGQLERLDSEATLSDHMPWQRQGSRSGSRSGPEMFRRRTSSDATLLDFNKSRQNSFLVPPVPPLPVLEGPMGPHLQVPKPLHLNNAHHLESLIELDPLTDRDRGLLIGGVRPLDIDTEKDDKIAEPELAVAEPEIVTQEPKTTHQADVIPTTQETVLTTVYPPIADPVDPCRILNRSDLVKQRLAFSSNIVALNVGMLTFALFGPAHITGKWVLAFICFIKSKDCLSSLLGLAYMIWSNIYYHYYPLPPVESKWILSLIPAYSEEEEMIKNCVFSLRDNDAQPHKQVMCIILDGKPRDVQQYMRITHSFRRHYVTSRFKRNELIITAGFMEDVPVICFEKVKNSGKKDSLILCHDLFNVMRDDVPLYTKLLREELERDVLPALVGNDFPGFDMVFCTDADSTIHKGAVADLANALIRDPKAIASCGLVLVEYEPGAEWSFWNLYQQFQYNFGQFVRRRAEHVWGKVTCLPGCITMIAVRPEMAGAIRKYAAPITAYPVLQHQVQYLGTDRRLTYSMLSQSKDLHTLFIPSAVSETVAPQSLKHYLSQRRRWGSNAYFNNYFYFAGENMIWITRICASIELVRLTVVYYRVANTIMFLYGLSKNFSIMQMIPLLVVSQLPTTWFLINVFANKQLRQRHHKIMIGMAINKLCAPFMSIAIFTNVVRNLGSQAWGLSHGATAAVVAAVVTPAAEETKAGEQALQNLLDDRNGSVESIMEEEKSTGTPSIRALSEISEKSGETESSEKSDDMELNEMDRTDPMEKMVGYIAAGL